ncbi:hypothetical protein [Streptococcus vestibularis]|uniref:hypothetical protein n=1 Tax=Streptococcus vestibularis TaxID=1343 RepID=UPI0026740C28|nr:hypothetical protein [Streptococcus vestibularis]
MHYIITKVGIMVDKENINDIFKAYLAEENPIKKESLLDMYNEALKQKQREVISRDYFVR